MAQTNTRNDDFNISWDGEDFSSGAVCNMEAGCVSCEG